MNKSLNQRIFEEVLAPMFPGEDFRKEVGGDSDFPDYKEYRLYDESLEDAFWLAEKVGLFEDNYYLEKPIVSDDGDRSWSIAHHNNYMTCDAQTIPEAICLAVLEIYSDRKGDGKKE